MYNNFRDELFHKFMHISRRTFHKTHARLESVGLYRGQPPLLFSLWEKDEQSRKELSQTLRIQPATVTKMVKRLSQNDFVSSKADALDSRVSRVCLTEKGKGIEAEVKSIYDDMKADIFRGFSEDEMMQFGGFLDRIGENIGTPEVCEGKCRKGEEKING